MRLRASLLLCALLAGAAAVAAAPAPALASKAITHNARDVRLRVSRLGIAVIDYTNQRGKRHHILAWGAKNAIAPTRSRHQRHFKLDYTGGWASRGQPYWETVKNACVRFPTAAALAAAAHEDPLPLFVTGCELPNGSFWALQAWKRIVPHGGLHKRDYRRAYTELHLSHWNTALPKLELHTDWIYYNGKTGFAYDHLWGRFTYLGVPVHGFGSNSGDPTDTYGRNLYVDTLNSKWGSGWWRLQAFLTHRPAGNFCVGTYRFGRSQPGNGKAYRATIMGPGVTPLIRVKVPQPGPYDAKKDAKANIAEKALAPPGDSCNHTH
jgi:hypothetical protein